MKTRKFIILHSNDMHGDFLAEKAQDRRDMIGGLALLSGYINQVRNEEENVIYAISGDMVQGSLIDSEYKGISTIEIMNYLAPDVAALGNHEFDYGLPHLLFLEKMANFPIVNANLYIKQYNKRLMRPYHILSKAGMEILFTGIITDKVLDALKMDKLIGSFVTLEEASSEVGKICNAYKNNDIDLTILLTHIGYESDLELASLLKPEWGVDMIIGGHSHTILSEPGKVNHVLIAQAGSGSDQIGRFDITVDDDTNSIINYSWKLVKIDESLAKPDNRLSEYIDSFKKEVDRKYNTMISRLAKTLTHPKREVETELGNYFADAFNTKAASDVMLVGSGSIRVKELGPVVTLSDVMTAFPYDDSLTQYEISGLEMFNIFDHIMKKANRGGEGECYQVNEGVKAVYDDKRDKLILLTIAGQAIIPAGRYTICLQGFHFNNSESYLGITNETLIKSGRIKVITSSARDVLEEYMRNHQNQTKLIEGRLIYQ
jgi:5'-nucleotidase / UDP-sugar diphosphatase